MGQARQLATMGQLRSLLSHGGGGRYQSIVTSYLYAVHFMGFFIKYLRNKRAHESPESAWSPPPMYTRTPERDSGASPAFWYGIAYLIEGHRADREGNSYSLY
ncbi:hypothetical protein EVAR_93583_1 [Eumeta japonica]|uniref:Uncharacterized protein n=1 Tax=Eumeta variegata TaxID=151549 RepID=A0A4C1SZW4_EUMVA|nr:hypothetical protein EVAR_93583_1 [Eumeta japonica]